MSKCYVVLWIPTVNHIPINFDSPNFDGICRIDINDMSKSGDMSDRQAPLEVKVVAAENRNIEISVKRKSDDRDNENYKHFITLKYEDSSRNGMVKYSYEPATLSSDSGFRFDECTFPEAIYHIIKGFYHTHEFHEDENDSSQKAYITTGRINIHEKNNDALRHYLSNHETTILNLVKWGKYFLRKAIDLEKQSEDNTSVTIYSIFPKMYVMAMGYNAYIHSLYHSIYNEECKVSRTDVDHDSENEIAKSMRRRAFNIENSIRYFNVLKTLFDSRIQETNTNSILKKAEENIQVATDNLKSSIRSSRNSTILAYISIIVGVVSIVISLYISNYSSQELNDAKNELVNTMNEIKASTTASTTGYLDVHSINKR